VQILDAPVQFLGQGGGDELTDVARVIIGPEPGAQAKEANEQLALGRRGGGGVALGGAHQAGARRNAGGIAARLAVAQLMDDGERDRDLVVLQRLADDGGEAVLEEMRLQGVLDLLR